jgi:anaphase-promoting complex subunit 5
VRNWIPWRVDEPRALARYVRPGDVGDLLELPGPAGDSPVERLGLVYAAVAGAGIRYAHEPPSEHPDAQEIRSPAEVLWAPKHATCLDLAVVLAGACLKAGLEPLILLIEGRLGRHALLGVRAGARPDEAEDDQECRTEWWPAPPAWLAAQVRRAPGDPGRSLIVLDPVGVSTALPSSPARGTQASFEQAVSNGAERLLDPGTTWQAGVDLAYAGRERETYQPADRPSSEPLRAPYLDRSAARSPLQLLRADYRVVPFLARDELTVLRHWCGQAASARRDGLAVIDGTGGSGKTRLALELAQRLRDQGWYAGLLRPVVAGGSWAASVEWLASVVSPVLAIVDYADARVEETKTLLRALSSRAAGSVVVLTARSVEGEWLGEIQGFVQRDGRVVAQRRFDLPPEHPDALAIFRRATAAFGGEGTQATVAEVARSAPGRWTTLDHILLAWLAVHHGGELPATRRELYGAVLDHEERYWLDMYQHLAGRKTSPRVLRRAAAVLTLLAPAPARAGEALRAVTELADAAEWREDVRRTFAECFYAGPGEPLALRPDPIADHLAAGVLADDPGLLDRCLDGLDAEGLRSALANLNRAASVAPDEVTPLFTDWLRRHGGQWPAVLQLAITQGRSALAALERLAAEEPGVLPLDELSDSVPTEHIGLTRLGLAIDSRRLERLRPAPTTGPDRLSDLLLQVSHRQSKAGDHDGALASISEAVQIRRGLAAADPVYLLHLAIALNNLSAEQADTGNHKSALASNAEAVAYYRDFTRADPVTFLPHLAAALSNLSNRQSDIGDRDGALASATEAVQIRRSLASTSPADLAMSLASLSNRQSDIGDQDGALASATEALRHYRALANANPAAYLTELATVLNNLSLRQDDTGDPAAALASATEAAAHFRTLTEANPPAHRSGLAAALTNLSRHQGNAGDRTSALSSITEAIQVRRTLADANPAAYLPHLALALNTLSHQQSGNGDRDGALASISEATTHYRTLAEANPALHLPDLAMSLNNLSVQQSSTGDRRGALASITEAAAHYRTLADANPDAYLRHLAAALNNLSIYQDDNGDRQAALASIEEAILIRRGLVEANPAAYLNDLASSLHNAAIRRGNSGDGDGALAAATEAVQIRRELAEANPAAYLPELAMSLNNLGNQLAGTGDRNGALATATEAVTHYRGLARNNAPAFLPPLAAALNDLSIRQSDSGHPQAALATITEAVQIRRTQASANPAAYLPDLATALNNLSLRQHETGDRDGALGTATEAVQIRRTLASANPAAYLPDLATALINLASWQSETGNGDGALASATEAATYYRALADAEPRAYLPLLGTALNNLSLRQHEAGDRDGALTTITEAVQIRRTLASARPAIHLADLAVSLSNLAIVQSIAGDRPAVLTSITEAAALYVTLARAAPATHLPRLVTTLNNLVRVLGEPLRTDRDPWVTAIAGFEDSLPRAELRANYAQALALADQRDAAIDQLVNAAAETEAGEGRALGSARLVINRTAVSLEADDPRLPRWAVTPVPDGDLKVIVRWAARRGWPDVEALLGEHADALGQQNFRTSLSVVSELFPGDPAPPSLAAFLADIDRQGLETVLASGRTAQAAAELLTAWVATATWEESASFLREHVAELTAADVRELLASHEDETSRQHLAVLELADRLPLDEVYQVVTDAPTATERALDAVEAGDTGQLNRILAAAPGILRTGASGVFLQAVLALTSAEPSIAGEYATMIATHGNPGQREALAIRLREFARHQPDPAPALAIADVIAPEASEGARGGESDAG